MTPRTRTTRDQGAALLFALATLAVLSVLATTFVRLAATERHASRAHTDRVRARFLAEAGIARAIGHLQAGAVAHRWCGLDLAWVSRDLPTTPIDFSTAPSFVAGTRFGHTYSGLLGSDLSPPDPTNAPRPMGGTYTESGDQYVVRVTDLGQRLDVRYPEPSGEGSMRVLANLERLLAPPGASEGVITARFVAAGEVVTEERLAELAGTDGSALAPYLTVRAWRDATALVALPRTDLERAALGLAPHGRAPILVNVAPLVLVEAALGGIAATWLDHRTGARAHVELSTRRAARLAARIDERRRERPFTDHADFEAFLADTVGGELTLEEAALVATNAHPDARLVKLNPDRVLMGTRLARLFDKSDLVRHTVEFAFHPTGVFELESLGRVLSPKGTVAARVVVQTLVRLAHVERVTGQAEWLAHSSEGGLAGLALSPEPAGHEAPSFGARVGLARHDAGGALELFAPSFFDPVALAMGTAEGTASKASALGGGDRFADGYHAARTGTRFVAYPGKAIPSAAGSIAFWWKPDWQSRGRTGALLYLDSPAEDGRGISTILYQHRGMLFASRTFYKAYGGRPEHHEYATKSPVTVTGTVRHEAGSDLAAIGADWLEARKPGRPGAYYTTYGAAFRDRVLRGIARGETEEVLYIYDVEKDAGLAHIGCVTHYIHLGDYYDTVFETGWEEKRQECDTLAYIDVVDESGNKAFEGAAMLDVPYAASRCERGLYLGDGWDPHRWRHVRLAWTDGTDLRLEVDGVLARDHARDFGPLTPWSSRLVRADDRLYPGPIRLVRASGEGGARTETLTGETLHLGHHGTLEGLAAGPKSGLAAPSPRYVERGVFAGTIAGPAGSRLVQVHLERAVPAGCAVRAKVTGASSAIDLAERAPPADLGAGATAAIEIALVRPSGGLGAEGPFVDSATFVFVHPPAVLLRREP